MATPEAVSSTPPQTDAPLKRELGLYASFAVAFGFVSIATGIFTTYGAVLNSSGPRGIWAWPIAVIGQTMVALIFGALAARIPISGYAYQWVSRLANPLLGWLTGWISFAFLVVVVVAVDYTIAATILPELFGYAPTPANCWVITAVVMLLQAVLVALSTNVTNRVNEVAVTVQIVGMVGITVLLFVVGAVIGRLDFTHLFETAPVAEVSYWDFGGLSNAGPFPLAFLLGAFTIVGFESAANLAEETKNPERVIPRAMVQAVVALGVLGMLFLVAVTALADNTVELAKSATPVATVITSVLGPVVGKILLVLIVVSIFSCGLVITLSGTRLVWAMSRDERFPAWQLLRKVSRNRHTPVAATIGYFVVTQAILAIFSGTSDALFVLFSAATLLPAIIYAGTVLLYIVKRKSLPASKGFTLGRWEIPVLVLASIWLIYELLIFRDASFEQPRLYVGIMLVVGIGYLVYLVATRGRKGLSMPDMQDVDRAFDDNTISK
ncbi:Serine/threonine exchanger SteT [Microbacterium azadirachtae]|uniref:Serine/threonine exchanger SteT n=1 Tax=Microbacterium azadirachtae TaxID=582680 RepID=A0A0F0KTT9_9MICO|nr:Serine/threonine exchanger SteT [Microbacterium azadirachtae]